MFARAVAAFIALPGVFAYLLPALVAGVMRADVRPGITGLGIIAAGTLLLLWCVVEFYRQGRGTLAPWSPPVHLVQSGPYRFSRNPMYLGVLVVLVGWALAFGSPVLWIYALAVAAAFHLRVVLGEEPILAASFGESWVVYRRAVPRWLRLPRVRKRDGHEGA